jgi:non-heme chloroperoxidase
MNRFLANAALCLAISNGGAPAQQPDKWRDSSSHTTSFVTVASHVQLEILNWGGPGSGRSIVLLAGFGHTAHVFDTLAPKLSSTHRVYGITRRGFGMSSAPESGYTIQRLTDDLLAVLDELKLDLPVLVGHSISGQEMSLIAAQHPKRIGGLVFLDAADNDLPGRLKDPTLNKLLQLFPEPKPKPEDLRSFRDFLAWRKRQFGVTPPESELRNCYRMNPDGSVGNWRGADGVWEALTASARKPDYISIAVPALALFAAQRSARDVPPWLETKDAVRLAALEKAYEFSIEQRTAARRAFLEGASNRRVVELMGADHYMFLSNEADVVREVLHFVSTLPN